MVLPALPEAALPPAGADAGGAVEVVLVLGKANRIDGRAQHSLGCKEEQSHVVLEVLVGELWMAFDPFQGDFLVLDGFRGRAEVPLAETYH